MANIFINKDFFLKGWRPYLWIALLVLVVYGQTLSFGFTNFDDDQLIINNYEFISNMSNLPQAFYRDVLNNPKGLFYYRPLLTISLMVDAHLGETKPFVYHLTNILVHIVSCWLVFGLFNTIIADREKALWGGLIFASHPVLVQVVAWIPGRNDSLLAVFVLLALLMFIKYVLSNEMKWLFLSTVLYGLALFTKETAIIVPLLCIGYVLAVDCKSQHKIKTLLYMTSGWALVTGAWFFMRGKAMQSTNAWQGIRFFSLYESLTGLQSYVGKVFVPINLSVIPDVSDLSWWPMAFVLVLFPAFLLFIKIENKKNAGFGIFWFLLFLIPVLFIIPGSKAFFEHRLYMPIIGLLIFLASLVCKVRNKNIERAVLIIICFLMSTVSFLHSRAFANDLSFWQNGVITSPHSSTARNGYGKALYKRGAYDNAETQILKALEHDPSNPVYLYNLGTLYLTTGELSKAEECMLREISLYPNYPKANFSLAEIYTNRGEYRLAEKYYCNEIHINPEYIKTYISLALLYYNNNDINRAVQTIRKAERIAPNHKDVKRVISQIYAWKRE